MILATIFLVLFSAVASTDSLYFHTYRYRLHRRRASRREHLLHTANIVVFVPQIYLLFCVRASGLWLLAAALLSLATLAIELADVLCENDSRRDLGGLIPAEYAMHFLMSGLRAGFLGCIFGSAHLADFAGEARLAALPPSIAFVGWLMVIAGAGVAALHVALCFAELDAPSVSNQTAGNQDLTAAIRF